MPQQRFHLAKAIAWLVLSPVALMMAVLSTVESRTTYYTQIFGFGIWSLLGVATGVGEILGARWVNRTRRGLLTVAVCYFVASGVAILSFLASAVLNGGIAVAWQGWGLTVVVLIFAVTFWLRFTRESKRRASAKRDA